MPAATPPSNRAAISVWMFGAHAARRQAGTEISTPRRSISLRPYRSPSAPRYSTDMARPSE